jgi:hypothetical protein
LLVVKLSGTAISTLVAHLTSNLTLSGTPMESWKIAIASATVSAR